LYFLLILMSVATFANVARLDDDDKPKRPVPKTQPKTVTVEDETIPDSLLHPRWKIQKTAPVITEDLDTSALDLHMPENVKQRWSTMIHLEYILSVLRLVIAI